MSSIGQGSLNQAAALSAGLLACKYGLGFVRAVRHAKRTRKLKANRYIAHYSIRRKARRVSPLSSKVIHA